MAGLLQAMTFDLRTRFRQTHDTHVGLKMFFLTHGYFITSHDM